MKSIHRIAEKRLAGSKSKGFSVMKGFFRLFTEADKTKKFVEYAPCLQGALPAFLHSAKNVQKFLNASFLIYEKTRVQMRRFDPSPYREEFGNVSIDDEQWQHAFNAVNVSNIT